MVLYVTGLCDGSKVHFIQVWVGFFFDPSGVLSPEVSRTKFYSKLKKINFWSTNKSKKQDMMHKINKQIKGQETNLAFLTTAWFLCRAISHLHSYVSIKQYSVVSRTKLYIVPCIVHCVDLLGKSHYFHHLWGLLSRHYLELIHPSCLPPPLYFQTCSPSFFPC